MRVNGRGWWRKTEKYLNWVGMDMGEVMGATGQEIKRRIAQRVELDWRREMEEKSTLWMYRRFRGEMGEEDYRGGGEDRIWFRARTNCLWLGDRNRESYMNRCDTCKKDVREDLLHFVLECERMEYLRVKAVELQRPRGEDGVGIVGDFLFTFDKYGRKKTILYEMWRQRQKIVKENEETAVLLQDE